MELIRVSDDITEEDILHPWVFTGMLFGVMMPYVFAALSECRERTSRSGSNCTCTPRQHRMWNT